MTNGSTPGQPNAETLYTDTNRRRARRFKGILQRCSIDADLQSALVDLLADARHWCDQQGESYAELDRIAYQHYLTEFVEDLRRRP